MKPKNPYAKVQILRGYNQVYWNSFHYILISPEDAFIEDGGEKQESGVFEIPDEGREFSFSWDTNLYYSPEEVFDLYQKFGGRVAKLIGFFTEKDADPETFVRISIEEVEEGYLFRIAKPSDCGVVPFQISLDKRIAPLLKQPLITKDFWGLWKPLIERYEALQSP